MDTASRFPQFAGHLTSEFKTIANFQKCLRWAMNCYAAQTPAFGVARLRLIGIIAEARTGQTATTLPCPRCRESVASRERARSETAAVGPGTSRVQNAGY